MIISKLRVIVSSPSPLYWTKTSVLVFLLTCVEEAGLLRLELSYKLDMSAVEID